MGTPGDQPKRDQQLRLPEIIEQPDEQEQQSPLLSSPQQQQPQTYNQSPNMPNLTSRPPIPTLRPDINILKPESTILPDLTLPTLSHPLRKPTILPDFPSTQTDPSRKPTIVVGPCLSELEPSLLDVLDVEAGPSGLQLRLVGDGAAKRRGNGGTRKVVGGYLCGHCQKVFPSTSKLHKHQQSVSTQLPSTSTTSSAGAALQQQQPFKCEHCKKTFTSKFKLVRHALIHSDRRPFSCTVCNRTFHRKDHLKNHCKVHDHSKELHVCAKADCNKEYTSQLSYKKHLALHAAEEGNLTCQLCHKTFRSKDEVLMHLKVHAGTRPVKNPDEKKYRCDSCDRRFFTRKDVRRHEVVHTGMRNFLCQFCPERFGRKDHLIRHIKKLHHQQQQQQQSTLDQQQQLLAAASSSSAALIKLEELDVVPVPVLPVTTDCCAATTYYDGGIDFLFSAAAVVDVDRRSSVYDDDDDERGDGISARIVASSDRVEDFKQEPPPLEDLGSNVLEDIAETSSSSSREVAAGGAADDIESSPAVDVDLVQLLQQTGKLPAFDQIFQLPAPQQQQQPPPDS